MSLVANSTQPSWTNSTVNYGPYEFGNMTPAIDARQWPSKVGAPREDLKPLKVAIDAVEQSAAPAEGFSWNGFAIVASISTLVMAWEIGDVIYCSQKLD